jgi:hypothetical protein
MTAAASRARWRRFSPAFRNRWNLDLSPFSFDMITHLSTERRFRIVECYVTTRFAAVHFGTRP